MVAARNGTLELEGVAKIVGTVRILPFMVYIPRYDSLPLTSIPSCFTALHMFFASIQSDVVHFGISHHDLTLVYQSFRHNSVRKG